MRLPSATAVRPSRRWTAQVLTTLAFAAAVLAATPSCGGGIVAPPTTAPKSTGPTTAAPASTTPTDAQASAAAGDANADPNQGTATAAPAGGALAGSFVFGAYKDVTISANWNTGAISTVVPGTSTPLATAAPNLKLVSWSFATGACGSETWGGITPAQLVQANVPAWVAANKQYILSTGGAAGPFTCATDAGFATFLDRYASSSLVGVDFDIEAGQSPAVIAELVARVQAAQQNPKYKKLRYSFTIATLGGNAPQSLGTAGVNVMAAIKAANLQGVFINLMVMDYGATSAANCTLGANGLCDMGASAVQAAISLNATYEVPFGQIELTPMVGGNDTPDETFTLADVKTVTDFAHKVGLGGIHYWSLDRDVDCAQTTASPTCNSYGKAGPFGFANAFVAQLPSSK